MDGSIGRSVSGIDRGVGVDGRVVTGEDETVVASSACVWLYIAAGTDEDESFELVGSKSNCRSLLGF